MIKDKSYSDTNNSYLSHKYGNNVFIDHSAYTLSLVNKLSVPETNQPQVTQLLKKCYLSLFEKILNQVFPKVEVINQTRMAATSERGIYAGEIIDPKTRVICTDLARAGMIPSQLFYEELHNLFCYSQLRQDHIYASRVSNEKGEVSGIEFSGSKIGGNINNSIVLIPDPMGATGGTICETISKYKELYPTDKAVFVSAHLMVTPEYIRNITTMHPEAFIFALRLDRGLSTKKALASEPGTFPDEEFGLNKSQYIIPGAGGVGELLNNSFV